MLYEVITVLISFGTIAAPRIGAAHRLQDHKTLKSINRTLQALGAAVGGSAAVLMVLLAPYLLHVVGSGYEIAATALAVMAVGQFLNALFTGQDVVLAMTGHGRILQRINLMQFVVCCVIGALLIPHMQMMGRITSYNVCYTKLLRMSGFGSGGNRHDQKIR